ncbi:SDR family NAD(P)-dependent oxidoreductase [Amycolatopsis rhabdoformis]|uniref:SDR family NAD(P)-dependent oxidoreductase n=1 Tax=Amycolatopsis rhabdoformis TaxID=1448059 RepID=A0ABZ1IEM8_9PSEU|nr:SDR family NAD(P)-dependent oxidoreductase [Amycolatopsis rhabdoformis]WSE32608.1 SDR family NAD(P)-dependent oxidoreductase [Amycolatopsis rhabdoformis]
MKDLHPRYGPYAVVTGASAGIGAEFATQLAAAGFSLVLVARRKEKLQGLADRLRERHGTTAEVVDLDLGREDAVAELVRRTAHLDVGLLVASAGTATAGPFLDTPLATETAVLDLSLTVPMRLAHEYGRRFRDRGRGALVLVSSAVAFGAVPYLANYSAAKAYVAQFGQALRHELKPAGVDVLVLAPGPTATEGFANTDGIDFTKLPMPAMSADSVVRAALRGLGRKALVIPGPLNKVNDFFGKHVATRALQTAMFGTLVRRALVAGRAT